MSEPVGSAAQEAARLFAAAEHWARAHAGQLLDGELLDDERLATGAPECTVCPVCQGVTALRSVQPEAVEHLLDAAASLLAALRAGLGAGLGAGPGGTAAPQATGPASRAPHVQHIDVKEGEWG